MELAIRWGEVAVCGPLKAEFRVAQGARVKIFLRRSNNLCNSMPASDGLLNGRSSGGPA
jgi:hypothetical protein